MAAQVDTGELAAAFRSFNELSTALESSYRDLEREVARLRGELETARHERRRQRVERARLAARLAALLEALPGGVVELDAEGVVRAANPAARELLGTDPVGHAWSELQDSLGLEQPLGGEARLPNGRRLALSRRRIPDGEIVLLTDCTEAALVRELQGRQQRLATLGEMAASLAHQVRTPLAAALLWASRLGSAAELGAGERQELAGRVVGRLRHLEGLVADMLAFARGGGAAHGRCDVGALLEGAAQSLASRLGARARLTIRTRAPGLAVQGSAEALVGALVNLAANALDAAGPDAAVELEAALERGCACIRVRDDGPGVPPEHRARIFEPFYTTRSSGTGLGLAVVRSVALAHGGSVELEEVPRGACFVLRLPALAAECMDVGHPATADATADATGAAMAGARA